MLSWDTAGLSRLGFLRDVKILGRKIQTSTPRGELLYLIGRVRNAKNCYFQYNEKKCEGAFQCDLAIGEQELVDVGCRDCSGFKNPCKKFCADNDDAMKYEFLKRKAWFRDPIEGRKAFLDYFDKFSNQAPPTEELTTEAQWKQMEALLMANRQKAEALAKAATEKKEKEMAAAKLIAAKAATGASSSTAVIVSTTEGETKNADSSNRKKQMAALAKRREYLTKIRDEKQRGKKKNKNTIWKSGGSAFGKELKSNEEAIKALEQGADANEYNGDFKKRALSELFFQKSKKNKDLVLSLLSQDHIDLSEKTKFGDTFLISALDGSREGKFGDAAVFEQILKIGEDPSAMQVEEFGSKKTEKFLFFECVLVYGGYNCDDNETDALFKLMLKYGLDVDAPIHKQLLSKKYRDTQITYRQILTTVVDKYTYGTDSDAHIEFLRTDTKSGKHYEKINKNMTKKLAERMLAICNTTKLLEVTDSELVELKQQYDTMPKTKRKKKVESKTREEVSGAVLVSTTVSCCCFSFKL